jgi:hypothetical protein
MAGNSLTKPSSNGFELKKVLRRQVLLLRPSADAGGVQTAFGKIVG